MTDREKLIDLMYELDCEDEVFCNSCGCRPSSESIVAVADHLIANGVVVREKGEWERVIPTKSAAKWSNKVACPVCHRGAYVRYNFCPNCGADMRKGENG